MKRMKKIDKPIDGYSVWNYKISFNTLAENINTFMSPDLPTFSFGSGDGKFEKFYNDKYHGKEIICIEPFPGKFNKSKTVLRPKYPNLQELMFNSVDIVENSQVLLIWATSTLNYDIDVIKKLKPKKFVVLWDSTGCAGSEEFHRYIGTECNGEYKMYEIMSEYYDRSLFCTETNNFVLTTFERII